MSYRFSSRKINFITYAMVSWRLSALLILSCLLGGTSQAYILPKFILNLIACLMIIHILIANQNFNLRGLFRAPFIFGIAFLLLFLSYFISVPQEFWGNLPFRDGLVYGQSLLAMPESWRPLGLAPEDSIITVWNFLPPTAIAAIMVLDLRKRELENAINTLMVLGLLFVIIGLVQFAIGNPNLYLYPVSNVGYPSVNFSNTNHFATFLIMITPLALYNFILTVGRRHQAKMKIFYGVFILAAIPVVVLTDSLAGFLLLPLALLMTLLVFYERKYRYYLMAITVIIFIGLVLDLFFLGNLSSGVIDSFLSQGKHSRLDIFQNVWANFEPMSLLGTGPGSFYDVYMSFESREGLTLKYANAAHNDFLQIWLEMGLLGVVLMATFLIYSILTYLYNLFQSKDKLSVISAVSVVIVMIASLADYPLRTITLSVMLTFFAIIMSGTQRRTDKI